MDRAILRIERPACNRLYGFRSRFVRLRQASAVAAGAAPPSGRRADYELAPPLENVYPPWLDTGLPSPDRRADISLYPTSIKSATPGARRKIGGGPESTGVDPSRQKCNIHTPMQDSARPLESLAGSRDGAGTGGHRPNGSAGDFRTMIFAGSDVFTGTKSKTTMLRPIYPAIYLGAASPPLLAVRTPPSAELPLPLQRRPLRPSAVCRLDQTGRRTIVRLRWGLVPFWAKDIKIGSRLITARAESVHFKPSFSAAFRSRRCLCQPTLVRMEAGRPRQAALVRGSGQGSPLSLAALWERWKKLENRSSPLPSSPRPPHRRWRHP